MKNTFNKYFKGICCLFFVLGLMASCSKDTVEHSADGIKMRVQLKSGFLEDIKTKSSVSKTNGVNGAAIQSQIISLGGDYNMVAELVPEFSNISTKQAKSSGLKAALQNETSALATGTKYRLLVYDANGVEVVRQDRTVGANPQEFEEFDLDAVGQYTFIAYSAGLDDIPAISGTTLADFYVTVTEAHKKFMYFKETVNVVYGINSLDVILANKLSEIVTIIDATNIGVGSLTGVVQPRFVAASHSTAAGNRATVKLSDGSMIYPGSPADKGIAFPSIGSGGTTTLTSTLPTVLVNGGTTTGSLRIGYIVINGLNKEVNVNDIAITPGVKYELRLKLNKGRCMQDVEPQSFAMDQSNTTPVNNRISKDFTFSAIANGGVVLDIYKLDNSFNMLINGVPLANDEIDFQPDGGARRTAEFTDGTRHQAGGIPAIYNLTGAVGQPVIRLTITADGQVTMEGRKTQNDPTLYPMQLYGNVSGIGTNPPIAFNTVNWKSDGTFNEVTVSQNIVNITNIQGQVYGKQIVDCNTGLPVGR